MGAFSDLDRHIDSAKERAREAKEDFDEWRKEDR